ncbi:hypothetical protein MPER_08443, partial [Moniliophthora perniciosa FA553]
MLFGGGTILWGNVPAIDILGKTTERESFSTRDLTLAFIDDYNGTLNILLNDRNPVVVSRNVLIFYIAQQLMASSDGKFDLTKRLPCHYSNPLRPWAAILANLKFDEVYPGTANNALNAVMNAPERVDYRDRVYTPLKPSHRVALQEWRRFGGQVWFYDSAIPLEGWDIDDILRAGRKHGTTEEDIMGCLHYHVKDELTAFFRRLRKFSIAFSIYDQDAIELSDTLPPHLRQFDRIEVSNIVDHEYAGISPVLTKWGPMLNRDQSDSTLIASFINWAARAPKARAAPDMSVLNRAWTVWYRGAR